MEKAEDVRRTDGTGGLPRAVRGKFDWSETVPTVAVVETVAVATDTEPLEVYALHDVIETDALDSLVTASGTTDNADVTVTFSYAGCDVTVRGDGLVRAEIQDED